MSAKDRFVELEKKVSQIADRLRLAQQLRTEHEKELERLRNLSHTLEQEIKSLKKERELVKNKVERILKAIDNMGGE